MIEECQLCKGKIVLRESKILESGAESHTYECEDCGHYAGGYMISAHRLKVKPIKVEGIWKVSSL